jgi:hypothetical protein
MLIQTIKLLFDRDLKKLRTEIDMYQEEQKIWHTEKNIANSAGNLCLHLIGNLNTYIGQVIGNTNYIRNRDLEFSLKNLPKAELLRKIDDTILVVSTSLDRLTDDDLSAQYPLLVFEEMTSTEYMLLHLTTHLNFHLGQINYHRRLLDN